MAVCLDCEYAGKHQWQEAVSKNHVACVRKLIQQAQMADPAWRLSKSIGVYNPRSESSYPLTDRTAPEILKLLLGLMPHDESLLMYLESSPRLWKYLQRVSTNGSYRAASRYGYALQHRNMALLGFLERMEKLNGAGDDDKKCRDDLFSAALGGCLLWVTRKVDLRTGSVVKTEATAMQHFSMPQPKTTRRLAIGGSAAVKFLAGASKPAVVQDFSPAPVAWLLERGYSYSSMVLDNLLAERYRNTSDAEAHLRLFAFQTLWRPDLAPQNSIAWSIHTAACNDYECLRFLRRTGLPLSPLCTKHFDRLAVAESHVTLFFKRQRISSELAGILADLVLAYW